MMTDIVNRLKLLRNCSNQEHIFQDRSNVFEVEPSSIRCLIVEMPEERNELNRNIKPCKVILISQTLPR
jgi:hypothetical protein